jgi:phosphate transport system substrate-binding protein
MNQLWSPLTPRVLVRTRLQHGTVIVVAIALALAACGNDDSGVPSSTPNGDGIDYGSLSGEIRIDGSSTVFPITEAVAEEFSKVSDTRVNVAFSGTGGGFEKFCRGETQISDASRPIKEEEIAACADKGIDDILELQVATDALTIVVNKDNDFLDCLNVQQLHDLFAGDLSNWHELDPTYPDKDIVFYFPDPDSGTFDYFVEAIIDGVDDDANHRGDGTYSADDNILALGIEGDEYAIGYFGFAYFLEAADILKAVQIDNGDGCVEPTFENALDGSYAPLSRPLFIYTRVSFLSEHPDNPVLGFTKFYLDNTKTLVPDVGYVTMPDDVLAQQEAKIDPYLP